MHEIEVATDSQTVCKTLNMLVASEIDATAGLRKSVTFGSRAAADRRRVVAGRACTTFLTVGRLVGLAVGGRRRRRTGEKENFVNFAPSRRKVAVTGRLAASTWAHFVAVLNWTACAARKKRRCWRIETDAIRRIPCVGDRFNNSHDSRST